MCWFNCVKIVVFDFSKVSSRVYARSSSKRDRLTCTVTLWCPSKWAKLHRHEHPDNSSHKLKDTSVVQQPNQSASKQGCQNWTWNNSGRQSAPNDHNELTDQRLPQPELCSIQLFERVVSQALRRPAAESEWLESTNQNSAVKQFKNCLFKKIVQRYYDIYDVFFVHQLNQKIIFLRIIQSF